MVSFHSIQCESGGTAGTLDLGSEVRFSAHLIVANTGFLLSRFKNGTLYLNTNS